MKLNSSAISDSQEIAVICTFSVIYKNQRIICIPNRNNKSATLHYSMCKNSVFFNTVKQFSRILFRAFPLENNVSDDFPKILPVGAERMLQIGLEITTLAVLNLVQGLRHIDIEWG